MQQILMMRTFYPGFVMLIFWGCTSSPPLADRYSPSTPTSEDSVYSGVYAPWEGHWEGVFSIYTDPQGQREGLSQPRISDKEILDSLGLVKTSEVSVKQFYQSVSPFVQKVSIEDSYLEKDGSIRVVKSSGYNTVEGGKLVCLVQKPDDRVIHSGSLLDKHIIIWERSISAPKNIEYFYEQVELDTYYILGWGYYGEDDPSLSPKTWFYGEYHRPDLYETE
ncbi:MAG: hypothetical protein AAF587_21820 [Bacteroidota bacterium]